MKNIKAIIFDLGGVILNINYQNTIDSFKKLGVTNTEDFYSKKTQTHIFNLIETGEITSEQFLSELQELTENATIKEVKDAWDSMLLDLPQKRLDLLLSLKRKYKLFLLSNTNAIHINSISKKLGDSKWKCLCDLFDKMYLSHEIGVRKPNIEAFQFILKQKKLNPNEVLFIDDSPQHIEGAKKLGIICYHLKDGEDITTLFPDKVQSALH
jgi:putative hydrolase of the HAD superfamily